MSMTFLDECKRWTRSSIPGRKIFEANNLFDHSKTRERSASTGHAKKRPASETGQEKFEIIVENCRKSGCGQSKEASQQISNEI